MVRLSLLVLGVLSSAAASYEKIAGYAPASQVTDHNAIDLDQKDIESLLALSDFANAKVVYEQGGHSKSYAEFTFAAAIGTTIAKSTPIQGTNDDGISVSGKSYAAYDATATTIKVQYTVSDTQATYVQCQVGGIPSTLGTQVTTGCFSATNNLTVSPNGGASFQLTPTSVSNKNGRTIQGFSTAARSKMYDCSAGCPYIDYKMYYDYYGDYDYADKFVLGALDGTKVDYPTNGDIDFSTHNDLATRTEAVKKGTAYMNIWMYVIREFEDAIDDCEISCITCNDDPVHAWDEGVAFYTGSLAGPLSPRSRTSTTSNGKLLYALADKRCGNFNTCSTTGDEETGTSKVNYDLFNLFAEGKNKLLTGQCLETRSTVEAITAKMTVPLIQGTLRYAYKVDKLSGAEKEKAEGAVFAAAVLPRLHYCSASAASIVYENMKLGASSTSFESVKKAFEGQYACMNITCTDVGGLLDSSSTTTTYYPESAPCTEPGVSSDDNLSTGILVVLIAGGCVLGLLLGFLCLMMRMEKKGQPIFTAVDHSAGAKA